MYVDDDDGRVPALPKIDSSSLPAAFLFPNRLTTPIQVNVATAARRMKVKPAHLRLYLAP